MPRSIDPERYVGLDLLRGLSALYIVGFWHMLNYTDPTPPYMNFATELLTEVFLAVFVLLSALFLGVKVATGGRAAVGLYFESRFLRVYPLYLLSILVFYVLGLASGVECMKSVFCVAMFWKPAPPTLWFVNMLMVFYIVSPALAVAIDRLSGLRLALVCIAAYGILALYSSVTGLLDNRLLLYFPVFLSGMLVARRGERKVHRVHGLYWLVPLGSGVAIAHVTAANDAANLILDVPVVVVAAYCLCRMARGLAIGSRRAVRSIWIVSYASYCLYLFHRPLYVGLTKWWLPDSVAWQIVYLVGVCLPIIVFAAFTVQRSYDFAIARLAGRTVSLQRFLRGKR